MVKFLSIEGYTMGLMFPGCATTAEVVRRTTQLSPKMSVKSRAIVTP